MKSFLCSNDLFVASDPHGKFSVNSPQCKNQEYSVNKHKKNHTPCIDNDKIVRTVLLYLMVCISNIPPQIHNRTQLCRTLNRMGIKDHKVNL